MGMAARYLNRLVGAKLLSNKSSSALLYCRRSENLMRLLCTTTTTTTTSPNCRGNSTVGSGSGSVSTCSSSLRFQDNPYSSVDFLTKHSLLDEQLLEEKLPVLCRTIRSGDSSLLERYCCSQGESGNIEVALDNELVAMCVWFLFIHVPPHLKGVLWGLKDICSRTSEAATNTHMHERVRHALTDVSFDAMSVNALVVDVLCSKNDEVLRQVCSILGFVGMCWPYQTVSFGDGIQKKLIQLSRTYDSPVLAHILFAINNISMSTKGMREKIIEAESSDGLLRRILRREGHNDFSIEAEVYNMVYTIVQAQCSDEFWEYVMEHLMSAVVDRCFVCDINVNRARARVISKFIFRASPRYIKKLVDLGCLKTLIRLLNSDDATIKGYCFKAVETILSLGDAYPSKNEYAKTIDDLTKEWDVFYVNNPQKYKDIANKGSNIVKKYRRNKHPAWLKKYLGGFVSS